VAGCGGSNEQVLSSTAASLQPYYPGQAAQLRAKADA
jgi:hypothetical protein